MACQVVLVVCCWLPGRPVTRGPSQYISTPAQLLSTPAQLLGMVPAAVACLGKAPGRC
jgi:hypothetical protein